MKCKYTYTLTFYFIPYMYSLEYHMYLFAVYLGIYLSSLVIVIVYYHLNLQKFCNLLLLVPISYKPQSILTVLFLFLHYVPYFKFYAVSISIIVN